MKTGIQTRSKRNYYSPGCLSVTLHSEGVVCSSFGALETVETLEDLVPAPLWDPED